MADDDDDDDDDEPAPKPKAKPKAKAKAWAPKAMLCAQRLHSRLPRMMTTMTMTRRRRRKSLLPRCDGLNWNAVRRLCENSRLLMAGEEGQDRRWGAGFC